MLLRSHIVGFAGAGARATVTGTVKWSVIGIVLLITILGGLFGGGRGGSGRAFDEGTKRKLLALCNSSLASMVNEDNTQSQVDLACKCFANDFHGKYGGRPVREIRAGLEEGQPIRESAQAMILKCSYAAGLN
jgi:hypothetical protein